MKNQRLEGLVDDIKDRISFFRDELLSGLRPAAPYLLAGASFLMIPKDADAMPTTPLHMAQILHDNTDAAVLHVDSAPDHSAILPELWDVSGNDIDRRSNSSVTHLSSDGSKSNPGDCPECAPKYKKLYFLQKNTTPSFKSKEIWTLQNPAGTGLFTLDCDSDIDNILELVDFTDKKMKSDIMSGVYARVKDTRGRRFAQVRTKSGTRYFTIQPRDSISNGVIDIDGTINDAALGSVDARILRYYIGVAKGNIQKNGILKISGFEDSGDLLIPYVCCPEIPVEVQKPIVEKMDSLVKVPEPYDSTLKKLQQEEKGLDSLQQKYRMLLEDISKNRLKVSVGGGLFSRLSHTQECDCSEKDLENNVLLFDIDAYAKIAGRLHLNASLRTAQGKANLSDAQANYAGLHELTMADFKADARWNAFNLWGVGVGPGVMFEYDGATQRGNIGQVGLEGTSSTFSGYMGPVFFLQLGIQDNMDAGVYYGNSNNLGNIVMGVVRVNELGLGDALSLSADAFVKHYSHDKGSGNLSGGQIKVIGPQLLGFLSPYVGYSQEGIVQFYDKDRVTTGTLRTAMIGVHADIARFLERNETR